MSLDAADIAALSQAGRTEVTVARLDAGRCAARMRPAARLAQALVPDPATAGLSLTDAFTGRVNLNATGPGLAEFDAAAIHALNRIDPAITLATLPPLARVARGMLVGTVKIITYGVARGRVDAGLRHGRGCASASVPSPCAARACC